MRRNPFTKLFKKSTFTQAADDFRESVREAERMIADGTMPEMPTHLSTGMYAGVAIRDVPSWFLQSMIEQGPLEYALGEAVGGELFRRETGQENFTPEDVLRSVNAEMKQAHSRMLQAQHNKEKDNA